MFDYIVQSGDDLYRIADYFDVSVQAILAANPGLNPYYLYVGQPIRIPLSVYLYQRYPWYYLYPYIFIRFPRSHWDDRRWWPDGWSDGGGAPGGGRPPFGGGPPGGGRPPFGGGPPGGGRPPFGGGPPGGGPFGGGGPRGGGPPGRVGR